MPVAGKMKLTIYVDPENVEIIRSQWVKSGEKDEGIGKLVDAYLAVLAKGLKAGKAVDRKGRFNWMNVVKEMLFMKPV